MSYLKTHLRIYISFLLLLLCWLFAKLFYRMHRQWVTAPPQQAWEDVRVIVLLNHTSLYEWLLISAVPLSFVYQIAKNAVIPIADITTNRPFIGAFFKLLTRQVIPISRKADDTWKQVLSSIDTQSIVIILPEGRMMRENQLDKNGKPMTVRGGIADILSCVEEGNLLIGYSGGLHHVQTPGQTLPKLFKHINLGLEQVDIVAYKQSLPTAVPDFKRAVIQDLNQRRDTYVSQVNQSNPHSKSV